MLKKPHKLEEIVAKLRQVGVLGKPVADAIRTIWCDPTGPDDVDRLTANTSNWPANRCPSLGIALGDARDASGGDQPLRLHAEPHWRGERLALNFAGFISPASRSPRCSSRPARAPSQGRRAWPGPTK
jgi:hypothetical protein